MLIEFFIADKEIASLLNCVSAPSRLRSVPVIDVHLTCLCACAPYQPLIPALRP